MSRTFEPTLLPEQEKERLCRELLSEFGLPVKSTRIRDGELIIPCRLGPHQDQERNPTAALNFQKLTFKCLGCGQSGGLLWFIAEHRGSSSTDARKWLAKETGTDGEVQDLSALLRFFDALYGQKEAKAPLPTYSERVLEPWMLIHPYLTDPPVYDDQGRNVGGRGIPEETVLRLKYGYAEQYPYDKQGTLSERIILPHFWKGSLVGWQSRRLSDDGTAKFKSTPDFPKYTTIYNYDSKADYAIVVEAMLSVARHDHHLHFEATFGKDITDRQIKLLGRHPRLIWWLDNDPGGWGAYEGLHDRWGRTTKMGVLEATASLTDVRVVMSPYPQDPADLPDDLTEHLVERAVPWPVWEKPTAWQCFRCGGAGHGGGCAA